MPDVHGSNLDRIVFGASIEQAARHCNQIYIPAVELVAKSDMHCEVVWPGRGGSLLLLPFLSSQYGQAIQNLAIK